MSQIIDVGPSFYFMKSRKIIMKTLLNLPVFCHKIKTRTYIKMLRHGSLQMNVLSMSLKLKICNINNKRDILDKKNKSEKIGFKLTYPVIIVQIKCHQYIRIESNLALLMIYNMCIQCK